MSVPQPRRAQTYDDAYADSGQYDYNDYVPEATATTSSSRSLRNFGNKTDNTMADPPPPPSYDTAVGSPDGSTQDNYSVDYSAPYADYIEDYSERTSPNASRPTSGHSNLEADFANLSMAPNQPQYPYARAPRQRAVTEDFGGNRVHDSGASVYSLDTGTNAYSNPPPMPRPYGAGPPSTWNKQFPPGQPGAHGPGQAGLGPGQVNNQYYYAANDLLGPPGQPYPGAPPPGAAPAHQVMRQASTPNLARTNTTRSTISLSSVISVPPPRSQPAELVGASSTRRRGGAVAIDVSRPPYTRAFVDDYRNRMKVDPDPEAQFAFAKYLIEAAKKIGDEMSARDPRAGRKYRDNLLAESLRNVKKLAEGKEPYADAQFFLANLYGTGQLGLQVDHEKAYYLYLMASKLSHPAATYRAAVCCELGAGTKRDPNRSVLFYRKAAALGDTAAMYKLALILLNGLMGHPRNPREAYVWLRRAATQADEDNPHALHELALLHERQNNGTNGVIPFDLHAAREYLAQAAQLGYAPAQFKLGQCHEFGSLSFPIDPRRSIAWYTRAAERGDSEAELALSGWYLTGSEGVLKQSDTEAYLWGRKAANKGLAKAEYAVGYYTEIGIGVKQDIELAKRWYQRAAMQGNKRAMQRLQELNNSKLAGKGSRPTRKDAESECVVM